MSYLVLNQHELPRGDNTYEFEGLHHQDTGVSFIWVDMPLRSGVRLHKHPYPEIFIVQEGVASFTVGTNSLEARAGQIILVPKDTPHKFVNVGDKPLRQIDIHVSRQFITDWLEDEQEP